MIISMKIYLRQIKSKLTFIKVNYNKLNNYCLKFKIKKQLYIVMIKKL